MIWLNLNIKEIINKKNKKYYFNVILNKKYVIITTISNKLRNIYVYIYIYILF